MFLSLSTIYSIFPSWIGLLADICTILWFTLTLIYQGTRITNIESKIININKIWDNVLWDKNIWNNSDDVIKYLDRLSEHDKEKYDKIMKTLVEHDERLSKAQHIDVIKDWDDYTMIVKDV